MSDLCIRTVRETDLGRCVEIESASFSPEEAASEEKILRRIRSYPAGFTVLERGGEIIGFINSGATHEVDLADEDFKDLIGHDPAGKHVVIMSVVTHPDHRGQGVAGRLLADFIARMKALDKSALHLICQQQLVAMYGRYGFSDNGASSSSHGGRRWHDMSLSLL